MSTQRDTVVRLARLDGGAVSARLAEFLTACEADADTRGIAVAVVGAGGELVAFGAHTACPALPRLLAPRKAVTAWAFRRGSDVVAREVAEGSLDLAPFHDERFLAMAGGVPVACDGAVIGAVGVSGRPAATDVALARRFAELLSPPV
jgi:glc operon protein GlcG